MRFERLTVIVGSIGVLVLTAVVARGEQDHLEGFQAKDAAKFQPAGTHTVTTMFGGASCTLKKAKFLLTQGEKDGGDDSRGGPAGHFVCYAAKCSGGVATAPTELDDQFGTHTLQASKTKIVCLPANTHACGDGDVDPGEACDPTASSGTCPGIAACNPDCTCPSDPCPGGELVGGVCWLLGVMNASCDTTCTGLGLACAAETATYAGTGGNDSQCGAVLLALGVTSYFGAQTCNSGGVGCADFPFVPGAARCTDAPTTCAAADPGAKRACACGVP